MYVEYRRRAWTVVLAPSSPPEPAKGSAYVRLLLRKLARIRRVSAHEHPVLYFTHGLFIDIIVDYLRGVLVVG